MEKYWSSAVMIRGSVYRIVAFVCMLFIVGSAAAHPVRLSKQERAWLLSSIKELDKNYDAKEKMLTKKLEGWNYHTDATSGNFHDTRASLWYAIKLLDYGGKQYTQRAIQIIDACLALQDTASRSGTRGVWPYFKEEPLATKKAPVDYNWADFNAVSLLDIWIEHNDVLPQPLQAKMKRAMILAAQSIQRRNVGPSYTNIAIMGTYVTYVVSRLFDEQGMQQYADKRLKTFYDYTISRGGFEEYNSPTYTIVALDELNRMQRHIKEPSALAMIDSLYAMSWTMIARHYHQPTGQWVGPHSRAYSPVVDANFSSTLHEASGGKVGTLSKSYTGDFKMTHKIPSYLLPYFLMPNYPRTESDVFVTSTPQVKGTAYMTSKYAVATANRASLWNQRHPLLMYWGNEKSTGYCQLKFLHDFYDFSSASFYSAQDKNKVLAGINFITNGGDKHISIDRLRNGVFKAKDLRLRFEFDGGQPFGNLQLPTAVLDAFHFSAGELSFYIQPYVLEFGDLKGNWETGTDGKHKWIDFVIYSGSEKEFNLSQMSNAALGFAMMVDERLEQTQEKVTVTKNSTDSLELKWENLQLQLLTRPTTQPPNL
ncbi:MAG TPA: hypothetical protein VLC98_17095 [Phnomibacter sp.]|nr:hypothetical protein [Phnomibacter sp.]